MRRRDFLHTSGGVFLYSPLLSAIPVYAKTEPDSHSPADTPEHRERYIRKMLKELVTDVGPHPVGTPACRKVELAIEREMRRSLPIVETDMVTFDRWVMRGTPEFRVGKNRIEVCPSHGTSGTPGPVSGILKKSEKTMVAYDLIDPSTGKLLAYVTESPKQHPAPRPWWFYDEETGKLANVCVGKRDFPKVTEAFEKGTTVRLNVRTEFLPNQTTSSIIGSIPGVSTDEIVYYAHHDTVYNSPGGNDNIAAVIMVLLVAHSFAGTRPKKTLTFIATTGEEYGYLGTKHLAKVWKENGRLERIKLIVDFDSVTWGPAPTLITRDEELVNLVRTIDRDLRLNGEVNWRQEEGLSRETTPLREAGLRARGIVCDSVPDNYVNELCWHSPEDKAKHVRSELVEVFFRRFREFMARIQEL